MDRSRIHFELRTALLLLGCAALSTACAGSKSTIKGDQLGQLPAADRQALMDEERSVDVAKANVDASKVALEESKQFRSIVGEEQKAAASAHKASSKELNLAAKTPNRPYAEDAAKREQVQADTLSALQAKSQFADRLVDLRGAEVDNHEAERALAEARLKHAQYTTLASRGLAGDLDSGKLVKDEREAEQNYTKTSQRVTEEQAATDASKQSWSQARQRAGVAAENASRTMEQPIMAPKPRETLPNEDMSRSPAKAPQSAQPASKTSGQPKSSQKSGTYQPSSTQGAAQDQELRQYDQKQLQNETGQQPQTTPTP